MKFFSITKQMKRKIFIGVLIVSLLFAFAFFFTTYFVSIPSSKIDIERAQQISEGVVEKIKRSVSAIEKELANPFYSSLKKYRWISDTGDPGKENPFIK